MSILVWTLVGTGVGVVLLAGTITLITSLAATAGVSWANGWQVRCTKCGRSKPASETGMIRIGGCGTSYTLGFCTQCERMRWVAVERIRD